MIIVNSPDITNLQVQVTFDISGVQPVLNLVNLSAGANLANVSYAFVAISPSGTYIHNGDISQPDITGIWASQILSDKWARPFNQIEWSGAPYQFYVIAKDSVGNTYQTSPQTASIVHPYGNTKLSKNTFGLASSIVEVKCNDARVFFQDTTNATYKGLSGDLIASTLRVIYPMDETANIPPPFQIANYSTALVPITYSSPNYQFLQNSIYDYDFGNDTFVRIKYQLLRTFGVWCNIDLQPLTCEINKLIENVESGNCSDAVSDSKKLQLVIAKLALVQIGISQPLAIGNNSIYDLVEEIKAIGGWDCDCCVANSGIIPSTASIVDGYSFSVNAEGGDVRGTFTTTGSNIQLNIADTSYIVTVDQSSPSIAAAAFSFIPTVSGDGYTKYYKLTIADVSLSRAILQTIGNDPYSLNYLNSLITGQSQNFELLVDGSCVFDSNISCDYEFGLANIPETGSYARITSIKSGNNVQSLSFSFNQSNLTGSNSLQSFLNSLGLGFFSVSYIGSGNVSIISNTNTFDLSSISYSIAGTTYQASLSKTCTGYTPMAANEVVQNIIDYLCGLSDSEVVTSQSYQVVSIDKTTGAQVTQTVDGGTALNSLISTILAAGTQTVQYVLGLGDVNCQSVQALYPASKNVLQSNDSLNGTKGGQCAKVYPMELFLMQLQTLCTTKDATILSALQCVLNLLSTSQSCATVVFGVNTAPYNTSCPYIYDLLPSQYSWGTSGGAKVLAISGVMFANTPLAGQSISIYYALASGGSYTLAATQTTDNSGNLSPAISIAGLLPNTLYNIKITSNCSSPAEYIVKQLLSPSL